MNLLFPRFSMFLLVLHFSLFLSMTGCYKVTRPPFNVDLPVEKQHGLYMESLEILGNLVEQTTSHLYEIVHDDAYLEKLVDETTEFCNSLGIKNEPGTPSVGHFFNVRYALASSLYANYLHRRLLAMDYRRTRDMYEMMMCIAKMISMGQGDITETMRFDKRFQVQQIPDGRVLITYGDDIGTDLAKAFIKSVVFNDVFLINGVTLKPLKQFINASEFYPHYASNRMILVLEEVVSYVEILQRLFLLGSKHNRYGRDDPKTSIPSFQSFVAKIDVVFEHIFNTNQSNMDLRDWKRLVFDSIQTTFVKLGYLDVDRKVFPDIGLVMEIEKRAAITRMEESTGMMEKSDNGGVKEMEIDTDVCGYDIKSSRARNDAGSQLSKSLPDETSQSLVLHSNGPKRRVSMPVIKAKEGKVCLTKKYYEMLSIVFNHQQQIHWPKFKCLMNHLGFEIRGVGGGSVFEFRKGKFKFLVHRPHPDPSMTRGKLKWISIELYKVYPRGIYDFYSK